MPEHPNLARVERLEDEAVPVAVVDHPRDPRRPAPPAPGQEDGAPVVPLPQIHVEPTEHPGGDRADQRGTPQRGTPASVASSLASALAASLMRTSSPGAPLRSLVRGILATRGPDVRLGDVPILPAGKLRGYGSEEEEKQGRTRDVPVPLEDRGHEVDR